MSATEIVPVQAPAPRNVTGVANGPTGTSMVVSVTQRKLYVCRVTAVTEASDDAVDDDLDFEMF